MDPREPLNFPKATREPVKVTPPIKTPLKRYVGIGRRRPVREGGAAPPDGYGGDSVDGVGHVGPDAGHHCRTKHHVFLTRDFALKKCEKLNLVRK